MPSGSVYTYVGNTDPQNATNQIQTSQGTVGLGEWGYFLPAEVQAAAALGLILEAGIVSSAPPSPVKYGAAVLGSDGTVGGPGGSPLTDSVVTAAAATEDYVPVADGDGGYTWEAAGDGTQAYGTLTTTNTTEQTVTISEGGDYEPVTWGSAGTADGVTLDADAGTITVGTTGAYLFALDLIVKATGTGKELAMSFCVNGEQVLEVVGAYALSGVAQAHFSGNFTGAFNEGDVVSVQATTTDAASTLVVTDGQFSALQSVALSGDAGVASVNDQTGVVTLSAGDVGAIGLGGELVEGNLIQASSDGVGEDSGLASSSVINAASSPTASGQIPVTTGDTSNGVEWTNTINGVTLEASQGAATLGANLATGSWTYTGGCTESGNGGAFAGGGDAGSMSQSVTLPAAGTYVIAWTQTGDTTGNVTVSLGDEQQGPQPYYNATGCSLTLSAGGAVTLEVAGDTTYNGTITNVTVEQITAFIPDSLPLSIAGTQEGALQIRANSNNAVGYQALRSLTTGNNNNAVGYQALYALTTGSSNTAVGYQALRSLTTGNNNNAVGYQALYALTTGSNNNAVGTQALYALTTGSNNNAVGYQALRSLTTGNNNNAVGYQALYALTTGSNNTAVGYSAAYAPGGDTAYATVTSSSQVVIGYEAGLSTADTGSMGGITTIGYQALAGGEYGTSLGYKASAGAAGAVAIGTDSTGAGASTSTADVIALGTGNHQVQLKNDTTGSGSAALGANSPAVTNTAPYTWFKMMSSDGSTVYVPAWK